MVEGIYFVLAILLLLKKNANFVFERRLVAFFLHIY